jgi:hypothetical protein
MRFPLSAAEVLKEYTPAPRVRPLRFVPERFSVDDRPERYVKPA